MDRQAVGRPLHPAAKRMILRMLMGNHGLIWAKDLPPPKKKVRVPEDLLPDLDDDE